jgi:hypothetical protein
MGGRGGGGRGEGKEHMANFPLQGQVASYMLIVATSSLTKWEFRL